MGLGLITLLAGCATVGPPRLTAAQALEAARRHVLAEEEDARSADLTNAATVPVDPVTRAESYFAFHFPAHGNTHYYVSKSSGFVHPVLVLPAGTWETIAPGSLTPVAMRSYPLPTLTKAERWNDYVLTIHFPAELAAVQEDIGFGCQLWEADDALTQNQLREFKRVLMIKRANDVRTLTVTISKADAVRFPIVDVFLSSAHAGHHQDLRFAEIPERRTDP